MDAAPSGGWASRPARPTARGRLLRCGGQSCRAGDGCRSRGQILLAESTAGLFSGVDLVDLGPRRETCPPPSVCFRSERRAYARTFRRCGHSMRVPGNLRAAITSFVGRESEVTEVEAALRTHWFVTLTGVGGVGKTRVAVEVAGRLANEFPDRVWVLELAAVHRSGGGAGAGHPVANTSGTGPCVVGTNTSAVSAGIFL